MELFSIRIQRTFQLVSTEGYLSDRVVLLLRLRERFVWGGASGRCHCQYGIGVKYIF